MKNSCCWHQFTIKLNINLLLDEHAFCHQNSINVSKRMCGGAVSVCRNDLDKAQAFY